MKTQFRRHLNILICVGALVTGTHSWAENVKQAATDHVEENEKSKTQEKWQKSCEENEKDKTQSRNSQHEQSNMADMSQMDHSKMGEMDHSKMNMPKSLNK